MKRFLLGLFLIPLTFLTQESWVNVVVQTDQYGGETSWEIYQDSQLVAVSPPYLNNSYNETLVELPVGQYNLVVYDAFGDGICCDFGPGYFGLTNSCGLDTFVYDFGTSQATAFFELTECEQPVYGCLQPNALNYNPWANTPTPCNFPPVPCGEGQTNILSFFTPDSYPAETSWEITVNGDSLTSGGGGTTGVTEPAYHCVNEGDTVVASIYDLYGDGMCGTCWGGVDGFFHVTTLCGDNIFMAGGGIEFDTLYSEPYIVPPCTPAFLTGCTNDLFVEYDPNAQMDDGSCITEIALGCTQESALNYDSLANTMETEDSCGYNLVITDGGADGWFGSWLGFTQGDSLYGPYQMGPNDGYEEVFEVNLNSLEEVKVYFFTSGNAETTAAQCGFRLEGPNGIVAQSGTNPWTDKLKKFPFFYSAIPTCSDYCISPVLGCVDAEACNFDNLANVDHGCVYPIEYYDCDNLCNSDIDNDGVCDELEIVGCMDQTAFNYNELATDPADCEPLIFGCTDATQYNYNPEANTDNGSCIPYIDGCTDSNAFNYDPLATADNGSCIEIVEGCADLQAYNYEVLVNIPDPESCLYEAIGCVTGLGEPYGDGYWLNDMCFAWLIQADPYCCEEEWDNTCQETFDYCSATGIEAILSGDDLVVYPNPVGDVLNINKNVDLDVFDSTGRLIISEININAINASLWTPGMYTLRIIWNNRTVIKRIVK